MKKLKFHQGDVQGISIEKLPNNVEKINNEPLAYGEVSGHIHVLTGEVEMYKDDKFIYAEIGEKGARVQHVYENMVKDENLVSTKEMKVADHKSLLLPKGIYKFGIQKRYNPFEKVFERVID